MYLFCFKSSERKNDTEDIVHAVAKELNVEIGKYGIQQAHRFGLKKNSQNAKLQSVIIHFASYKKHSKILFATAKLRDSIAFQSAFITEDTFAFAFAPKIT